MTELRPLTPCILESPYAPPLELRQDMARAERAYREVLASGGDLPAVTQRLGAARELVQRAEQKHLRYLRALARHALSLELAPFASHALYTQWLDDHDPEERALGIRAGFAWAPFAKVVLVGMDLGLSSGMDLGIRLHRQAGREIRTIHLGKDWGRGPALTVQTERRVG